MSTISLGSFLRITFAMILTLSSTALLHPPPAYAAYALTVTKLADTNDGTCDADCSLREAITAAASGDKIVFTSDLAGQIITLGSQLEIAKNLTIDGSSLSAHVKISGNHAVRVFSINSGVNVVLTNLDITNGNAGSSDGGGIFNSGTLMVQNSTISDNRADGCGGGISNTGTLVVQNSTISGNSAGHRSVGGGIANYATLTVTNSTLSGNSGDEGGGIYNEGTSGEDNQNYGMLTVQNSTLSGNLGTYDGGGIFNGGTLTVQNATLSGNSGGIYNYGNLNYANTIIANAYGWDCENDGMIGTNNHNLVEDGSCSDSGINFLTGDPLLGLLADNGGDTQTHALLPGSPAIDAGDDATCLPTDQRGVSRPQGAHCDIGAYEWQRFFIYLPLVLR